MRIEMESLAIEKGGIITAYCRVLRDDGTVLRRMAVQGADEKAVAAEARRKYEAMSGGATETLRERVRAEIEKINEPGERGRA